jgi:hypothetical protein
MAGAAAAIVAEIVRRFVLAPAPDLRLGLEVGITLCPAAGARLRFAPR